LSCCMLDSTCPGPPQCENEDGRSGKLPLLTLPLLGTAMPAPSCDLRRSARLAAIIACT
jgi:hypothetical protein